MKVLLSIKPEFANRIFDGHKLFEYRKCSFRQKVTCVVVYASAPVSKVIGEFEIDGFLYEDLKELWCQTKDHSGITEDFFYSYFANRDKGWAIKIKRARKYPQPHALSEIYSSPPPQSFAYLTPNESTPVF